MLPRTVSHGKTPYSWKITPRSGPGPFTGSWSSRTWPRVGLTKPPTMLISVVLPQPDVPMMETNSPRRTSRSTPSTPTSSKRRRTTSLIRLIIGRVSSCVTIAALSGDPVLPGDEPARREAKRQVHCQGDQADADDADVDGVELEERRRVLDQCAEALLRGDQLGGDQRRPGDAERDPDRGEDVRHGERNDDRDED